MLDKKEVASVKHHDTALRSVQFDTPIGRMIAVGDERDLFLLQFIDQDSLSRQLERLQARTKLSIVSGVTAPITSIQRELALYFEGKLSEFKTPLFLGGTSFQKIAWQALYKVPYGRTLSYKDLATAINNPKAYRAVARANATNNIIIVIPCHRVISNDGKLGGYNAGLERKQWLLAHESNTMRG